MPRNRERLGVAWAPLVEESAFHTTVEKQPVYQEQGNLGKREIGYSIDMNQFLELFNRNIFSSHDQNYLVIANLLKTNGRKEKPQHKQEL